MHIDIALVQVAYVKNAIQFDNITHQLSDAYHEHGDLYHIFAALKILMFLLGGYGLF